MPRCCSLSFWVPILLIFRFAQSQAIPVCLPETTSGKLSTCLGPSPQKPECVEGIFVEFSGRAGILDSIWTGQGDLLDWTYEYTPEQLQYIIEYHVEAIPDDAADCKANVEVNIFGIAPNNDIYRIHTYSPYTAVVTMHEGGADAIFSDASNYDDASQQDDFAGPLVDYVVGTTTCALRLLLNPFDRCQLINNDNDSNELPTCPVSASTRFQAEDAINLYYDDSSKNGKDACCRATSDANIAQQEINSVSSVLVTPNQDDPSGRIKVGYFGPGEYLAYGPLEFNGNCIVVTFSYSRGDEIFNGESNVKATSAAKINIHLDGPSGIVLGDFSPSFTGGWTTFQETTVELFINDETREKVLLDGEQHTVYLVGQGEPGIFNLDWIEIGSGQQQPQAGETTPGNSSAFRQFAWNFLLCCLTVLVVVGY